MERALLSKHMSILSLTFFINSIPLATAFSVPYNTSVIEVCSYSISLILFMTGIVLFHKVLKIYFWRSTTFLQLIPDHLFLKKLRSLSLNSDTKFFLLFIGFAISMQDLINEG